MAFVSLVEYVIKCRRFCCFVSEYVSSSLAALSFVLLFAKKNPLELAS